MPFVCHRLSVASAAIILSLLSFLTPSTALQLKHPSILRSLQTIPRAGNSEPLKNISHKTRTSTSFLMASSSDSTTSPAAAAAAAKPKYPPSRFSMDENGQKFRLCAGAAVLNSENQLLIGERINIPNAWQAPQGGVDDDDTKPESILDAASRELYEEMGLVLNRDVMIEEQQPQQEEEGMRYQTGGTDSWLTRSGFAGQELHWKIYRVIDSRCDEDPNRVCDLSGKNGEAAEFRRVKWSPIEDVVATMWEAKRAPYAALQQRLTVEGGCCQRWNDRCESLDFSGRWARDATSCTGLVEALVARGKTNPEAEKEVEKPYVQAWRREDADSSKEIGATPWVVTTFDVDGVTPRRVLPYRLGTWEETMPYQPGAEEGKVFEGASTLFGPAGAGKTIQRRTSFCAEPDADGAIAHVTTSRTPLGEEESRRYLKAGRLIVRRTFWSVDDPNNAVVSTETFVRS